MSKEKLYTTAILAIKPDPKQTVEQTGQGFRFSMTTPNEGTSEVNYDINITLIAGAGMHTSEDEAKEYAISEAKRLCPASEGWALHFATVAEVERGIIEDASLSLVESEAEEN
jgi:hypothetical protein